MTSKFGRLVFSVLAVIALVVAIPVQVFAATKGTYTPVTGIEVDVSGATDTSGSSTITVTAAGSAGWNGIGARAKTATVKIRNKSGSLANVSFTITRTDVYSLTVDKGNLTANGFSMQMSAEEEVTLKLQTSKNDVLNKIELSDFKCVELDPDALATVVYDNVKGSVSLAGSAVNSGDSAKAVNGKLTVLASPMNGNSFVAWINSDSNEILSTVAATELDVPQSMNIQAVFSASSGDTPWFQVGNYAFDSYEAAVQKAGTSGTIVLMNNAIFTEDYTISEGITFLIPYNESNINRGNPKEYILDGMSLTGSDFPASPESSIIRVPESDVNPKTEYRRLTLAENVTLTVNGSLEVSGQTHAFGKGQWGKYGQIQMETGSKIVVNNGGTLYAYGYIRGNGTVEAMSGSTVYEPFSIDDYPGGGVGTMDSMNSENVLAFKEFNMNNVEVPMTLYSGATEKIYFCVSGHMVGYNALIVDYIGSDSSAIAEISSGYLTKSWTSGRQKTVINGDVTFRSFVIELSVDLLLTTYKYTLDTNQTGMYFPSTWDVIIESGKLTCAIDVPMMAGSTVTVNENATLEIASGKNLYVFDADDDPSAVSNDAKLDVNGTVIVNGGLYTTTKGARIESSKGTGKVLVKNIGSKTSVKIKESDSTTNDYSLTPAQLMNADESYTSTAGATGGEYTYENGSWTKTVCYHVYTESITTAATCENAGVKTFTCACGDKYTEAIEATGHNMQETAAAVAPTCEAAGSTAVYTCANGCGKTEGGEVITATGHNYNAVVTAPTCTEKGYTTYTCSACGNSYVGDEVAALGHTWVDANCTTPKTCSVCKTTEGEALGHSFTNYVSNGDATCTVDGTETAKCDRCDATETVVDEGSALKHSFTNYVSDGNATCTADGTKTAKCDRCDVTETVVDEGSALEHSFTNYVYDGIDKGTATAVCGNGCGTADTKKVTLPEAEVKSLGKITVGSEGEYAFEDSYYVYDLIGGSSLTNGTEPFDMTIAMEFVAKDSEEEAEANFFGNYTTDFFITLNGMANGSFVGDGCYLAGYYPGFGAWVKIPLDGFTVENGKVYPVITSAGLDFKYVDICTSVEQFICGIYIAPEILEANPNLSVTLSLGLSEDKEAAQSANFITVDSYTYNSKQLHVHTYDAVVTAPTCVAKGYTTYTCSACGDSYVADETEMVAHTPAEAVKENEKAATCTTAGSYDSVVKCATCGEEIGCETVTVDALGHNFVDGVCTGCGAKESVTPEAATEYAFGLDTQIGLIEPWFVRFNIVIADSSRKQIDYSTVTDYGYYFVRGSELDVEGTPSVADVVLDSDVVIREKESVFFQSDSKFTYFATDYNKGLYTYEMSDSIYAVLYFSINGGERQYSNVKEANLSELVNERKDNAKFNQYERDVYTAMSNLEVDILAYREGKSDSDTTMGKKLTENRLPATGDVSTEYKFGVDSQIVLIEPWGLQVTTAIVPQSGKGVSDHVDYSEVDDYGIVMFYDADGDASKVESVNDMLALKDSAYIFSKLDGSAFVNPGNRNYIAARYNEGIFTYQLNTTLYAMNYVVIGGFYHFDRIRTFNVYDLASERALNEKFPELERQVYVDMAAMYDSITAYRDWYFNKQ